MYKCRFCNQKFENHYQLGGHIVSHNKVKCEVCGKLIAKNTVTSHMKIHKNIKKCLQCGKKLIRRRNKFCNHSCAAIYNNKGVRRHGNPVNPSKKCLKCGDTVSNNKKFCDSKCRVEYNYDSRVEMWLSGKLIGNKQCINNSVKSFVRKWMFRKAGNKCEKCGWNKVNEFSDKIPLTVHHKDGDSMNTVPDNIILLCPNCHSLTKNYGNLNKNSTRNR